jgi:hypothetical protein
MSRKSKALSGQTFVKKTRIKRPGRHSKKHISKDRGQGKPI